MKKAFGFACAALVGALIVVACSDDSPSEADAAVCDCPAAEAPITAARLHRVDGGPLEAAVNAVTTVAAFCPGGELFVSGSCYIDSDSTAREVALVQSGASPTSAATQVEGWACHFQNDSLTATAQIRAQAICLRP